VGIDEERVQVTQNIVIDGISFFSYVPPSGVPTADIDPSDVGNARFAGGAGAAGIVETSTATGIDPCEGVPTDPAAKGYDPGCRFYEGNTVALDPNRTGDYFVTSATAFGDLIQSDIILGDDFEMRFTEACATPGSCFGAYVRDGAQIVSVPFELWNVRDVRNPDDDVRMIPLIRPSGSDRLENWADSFTAERQLVVAGDTVEVGVTDRVYFMMPDREDGYALFEAAARGFGGAGAVYDRDNDGDTQIDLNANGGECAQQGYYIDFCYRSVA